MLARGRGVVTYRISAVFSVLKLGFFFVIYGISAVFSVLKLGFSFSSLYIESPLLSPLLFSCYQYSHVGALLQI